MHWAEKLAAELVKRQPNKSEYVCAAGISPSGSIHIGNFRDIATSYFVVLALRKMGKKAPELQCGHRVGVHQRVTDEDAILMSDENLLFFQDHAANAVSCCGNALTVILADVLVPVGAIGVPLVAVQPQVERGTMLDYGLIKRGQ